MTTFALRCLDKTIWTGDPLSPSIFSPDKINFGSDFSLSVRVIGCDNKEIIYAESEVTGMTVTIKYCDQIVKENVALMLDNVANRYYIILSKDDFVVKGSYVLEVSVTNTDAYIFVNKFFVEIA
jgi:hypothetical protein